MRQLRSNPEVPCIAPCPYHIISLFLRECPSSNANYPNPSLFRALTAKGINRTLTCNPLGISSIRDLTRLVNIRLPLELQIKNPTGHSGRVTLSSIAMNNNVGSVEVCDATKHKDPKSLLGYVRKDDGSLGAAALGISEAIKKRGRDFNEDENIPSENVNDSVVVNKTMINTSSKKMNYSDGKNTINLTLT